MKRGIARKRVIKKGSSKQEKQLCSKSAFCFTLFILPGSVNAKSALKIVEFHVDAMGKVS